MSYFAQELYFDCEDADTKARYHVYLTPPTDLKKGPLFICHHGAGSDALTWALFVQHLRQKLPDAGVLCLEARNHGSAVTSKTDGSEIFDFSLATLAADALIMINKTKEHWGLAQLPPTILVGHSMGGGVVLRLTADFSLGPALIGYSVLDIVEGSAVDALRGMTAYLASRPSTFASIDDAISWHLRSRTLRNAESAGITVPSLFTRLPSGKYRWRTNFEGMKPYWDEWFKGMDDRFLNSRGAKQLILAGTDRLDRDLMIGQMQGKFQLVVLPEAGHFVQEDCPEKSAQLVVEFFRRNDRSAMVLPPKVSELIAMGKKV